MQFSFKKLFGIPGDQVKPFCILTPFLTKSLAQGLQLKDRKTGNPYTCFQTEQFTLIQTRMGPLFTGDAVLMLKETSCETILFFGACGSLNKEQYPIGSIVTPASCYAAESFSQMVGDKIDLSHKITLSKDTTSLFNNQVKSVCCASIGSIILETQFQTYFQENKIDVLDMECASVFSGAKSISRNAAALLYVTDIIGETSPYEISNDNAQTSIDHAQKQIIDIIGDLTTV